MWDRATRNPNNQGGGQPKFYEGEIWLIRKLLKEGRGIVTQKTISKMFKVSLATIYRILAEDKFLCREGYYV